MSLNKGDFERGRVEAMENRERIDRLAKIEAESASAARSRHYSGGPRRDFAGILNSLVSDAAGRELPGLSALEGIRKARLFSDRTAAQHNASHDRFEKAGGVAEGFNRLHPRRGDGFQKDDIRSGDPRAQDYDPAARDVSGIEPAFLLQVARMLLAMARARAAAAPAGRRD
jgi:hypothetical protein